VPQVAVCIIGTNVELRDGAGNWLLRDLFEVFTPSVLRSVMICDGVGSLVAPLPGNSLAMRRAHALVRGNSYRPLSWPLLKVGDLIGFFLLACRGCTLPNFRETQSACRTIEGYEAMHAIRKGQVRWIAKGDPVAQRKLIHAVFGIAG
jgi:hypothetical protein